MNDDEPRGRLFVVTGSTRAERVSVASAVAARLERSIVFDCAMFEELIVSGAQPSAPGAADPLHLGRIRQLLLRWSAGLAAAETYQLEGFDAVVTDELSGARLEDFLDLAAPETVLLVVLDDGTDVETPRWGLWVRSPDRPAADVADIVLTRLDEAVVATDPDAAATS